MGSAAQWDERDKAEPAGTGESFQHTIHNTAWELKKLQIQPLNSKHVRIVCILPAQERKGGEKKPVIDF